MMNPHDTVAFRPADGGQVQAIAELSRDLIEAGLGWRYTPVRIAALIQHPEHVALVACDVRQQHRVLGFAVMQFGDEHAHLMLLCVRPEQQRRGIGRRLTEWLLKSAQVAGIASIRLELRVDNLAALGFYRRLGFVETQSVAGYYDGMIAARCMVRTLRRL